jgi:hypothetical protein
MLCNFNPRPPCKKQNAMQSQPSHTPSINAEHNRPPASKTEYPPTKPPHSHLNPNQLQNSCQILPNSLNSFLIIKLSKSTIPNSSPPLASHHLNTPSPLFSVNEYNSNIMESAVHGWTVSFPPECGLVMLVHPGSAIHLEKGFIDFERGVVVKVRASCLASLALMMSFVKGCLLLRGVEKMVPIYEDSRRHQVNQLP